MDTLFGIVGDGFVLLASDTSQVQSIVLQKTDEDKIMILDEFKLLGTSGETGDRVQFSELIQKNIHLYQYRNGLPLSTDGAAHYMRGQLATALRKGPYSVFLLLAGWDKETGPSLYYMDYLATMHKLDKASMGYGGYFMLSLMDKHWKPNLTLEEAKKIMYLCIDEVQRRLVVAPPNFVIKIVDKDGARELERRDTVVDATNVTTATASPEAEFIDAPAAAAAEAGTSQADAVTKPPTESETKPPT
ncbi:20S proteasome regulatory subunit beta protein [Klebsormidium nitens]|uniref:Proteasome subunit beta n=1 Tax=Klebsormidium nitens TaxID=105231 RepID=A0A1Y1I0B0_KLENI|nr:20S proteasome regulatory subunit beta protein [Klebsormidium nitens]|eukprot:GAQ82217.1 20S proteasome regulatory subunit beta protein [Klebsormidium nitens]